MNMLKKLSLAIFIALTLAGNNASAMYDYDFSDFDEGQQNNNQEQVNTQNFTPKQKKELIDLLSDLENKSRSGKINAIKKFIRNNQGKINLAIFAMLLTGTGVSYYNYPEFFSTETISNVISNMYAYYTNTDQNLVNNITETIVNNGTNLVNNVTETVVNNGTNLVNNVTEIPNNGSAITFTQNCENSVAWLIRILRFFGIYKFFGINY